LWINRISCRLIFMNESEISTIVRIRPRRGWAGIDFREIWLYRELLGFLIWREITVRYKQTLLGATWAVLQPVVLMVILSVVFGRFLRVDTQGLPYPIFSYSALIVWTYFSQAMRRSTESVVANSHLVTKIYFPRLIIPIGSTLSGLVDFGIALIVLIGMYFYYGIALRLTIVFLPLFLLMAAALAFGVGSWLSALNVRYRDINYVVPLLIQVWMFASPVAYSVNQVPENLRLLYSLNPMVCVVQGFRWALLGQIRPTGTMLGSAIGIITVVLVSGVYYFRRMETEFADVI